MVEKLGKMYKQKIAIQLLSTLLITMTLISLIEIYWFSLGIFSYIVIGAILIFRFLISYGHQYELQATQEESRTIKETERHNHQVYNTFLETMAKTSGNFSHIQYKNSTKVRHFNNDDRMEFLYYLEDSLKVNHGVDFPRLPELIDPYIELMENIKGIDRAVLLAAGTHSLQDLHLEEKLTEDLGVLRQYRNLLKEKANYYISDHHSTRLGLEGEQKTNEELALYDDILKNVSNVRFEVQGLSVETDNFVLSPFGIFAIEVKNLGSSGKFKIKIEKDGRWLKVFKNSTEVMKNITSQTYRHIGLNQKLINQELKKQGDYDYIHIKPLIVMANDKVEITNESDVPVVRISNIYHHITQFPKEFDSNILSSIEKIVKDHTLPPKAYEIEDIEEFIGEITTYLQSNMKPYQLLYKELTEMKKRMK